jgi:uncharacterized protein (TIGR02266 family)
MRVEKSREANWTLLLADDPELFVAAKGSFLTRSVGRVLGASSAGQVLEKTRAEQPDLVVLDGGGWGLDALRSLRADPRTARIPVLLAGTAPRKTEPGTAWLRRPVGPRTLERAASRILGLRTRVTGRRGAALRATVLDGERSVRAVTKDIGPGGLFLRTRERLVAGQNVQLIVDLPGESKSAVRAAARVSRVVRADRDSYLVAGVGVRFVRIGARDRAKIARFVAARETRG